MPGATPTDAPPLPLPPQVEMRLTGTLRYEGGHWVVESGTGTRYVLPADLPASVQTAGLVVTLSGTLEGVTGGAGDRVITSVTALEVLPVALPTPDGLAMLDDRAITLRTAADVVARRSALTEFVWGDTGMPLSALPTVLRDDSSPVPGLENLQQVHTLVMDMHAGRSGYAHHFVPARSNNRAVILHQGHVCRFDDNAGPADVGYGMRRTLNELLVQGYSVVTIYMPNHARFGTARIEVDDCVPYTHYGMFAHTAVDSGSPLKFFLTPTAMALNYLEDGYAYDDYSMVGFSGGGWTTAVYAALDPRITTSVHVGGTLPLYLQRTDLPGDSEQVVEAFYRLAGYPEIYALGASGPGRRQLQILNRHDDCCFSEHQSAPGSGEAFDTAVRAYERDLRMALAQIGPGEFRLEIDEAAPRHMISWNSVLNQILPELNGGHQAVAAASPERAFVRGANGRLWQLESGSWRDTGLPMVGTAAVVEQAVHSVDVFYRSPSNRLMHAYAVGAGWEAHDLGVTVLSDPAAVSWTPGRLDVVTIDAAYRLVHWWVDGGRVGARLVGTGEPTLGIGRPALVATASGWLHLFVHSRSGRALQVIDYGPTQTWATTVLPSTMLDFPGAVVDAEGVVRAYIRGASSSLWEAANASGAWEWTRLSSAAHGGAIQGTPSASLAGGQVSVHARTATGLATYRLSDGWTVLHTDTAITGSPTSTAGYAHAVSAAQQLGLVATGWIWRGWPSQ